MPKSLRMADHVVLGEDGYEYVVTVDPLWDWVFKQWRWHINRGGYVYRKTTLPGTRKSINVYLHRMIMGLEYGDPHVVDHLNGLPGDCRVSNLEVVTQAENIQRRDERQRRQYANKQ